MFLYILDIRPSRICVFLRLSLAIIIPARRAAPLPGDLSSVTTHDLYYRKDQY